MRESLSSRSWCTVATAAYGQSRDSSTAATLCRCTTSNPRGSRPMSRSDQAAWVASTSAFGGHWADGKYELFKTSTRFDGTAQNPQWLG